MRPSSQNLRSSRVYREPVHKRSQCSVSTPTPNPQPYKILPQIYGSEKYPQGFCLDISAGETVALVGPSGSGKSTCMGLLLRFYEAAKGSVTIDGRDIKEVNVQWLRSQASSFRWGV